MTKAVRALGLALAACVALTSGCGEGDSSSSGGRSEKAFCNTLHQHNKSMADRYHEAGDDFLSQTKLILQNAGEFRDLLAGLAEHAPDEVREDAEKVSEIMAETFKKATEQDVKPGFSGLMSSLSGGVGAGMRALMDSDSFDHLDAYAKEHCDLGVFSGPVRG